MDTETTQSHLFTRQPLSNTGKFAFWGLLIGAILCGILSLVLTLTEGWPGNKDILTMTACLLIALILCLSGVRWLQILGTLVNVFLLYLIFSQPFVMESLAAPKDPKVAGGFGHFAGDVIIVGCVLVGFVGNIGILIQNYQGKRQTPRWFPRAFSAVIGITIGALLIGAIGQAPVAAGAATTYTNGVPTVHLGPGSFLQSSVTINKGSKLLLVDDVATQHILSNGSWQNNQPNTTPEVGAPGISNLQLHGNSAAVGPFTTAGTYHIYCLVHQGMNLTIIVK